MNVLAKATTATKGSPKGTRNDPGFVQKKL